MKLILIPSKEIEILKQELDPLKKNIARENYSCKLKKEKEI